MQMAPDNLTSNTYVSILSTSPLSWQWVSLNCLSVSSVVSVHYWFHLQSKSSRPTV